MWVGLVLEFMALYLLCVSLSMASFVRRNRNNASVSVERLERCISNAGFWFFIALCLHFWALVLGGSWLVRWLWAWLV